MVSNSKDIDIVLLDNGQLTLGSVVRTKAERRKGIGDIKHCLSFVSDELAKSQIPLIFVLCPTKVPPGGVGLPPGLEDDDNLLGDLLVKTLRKAGIDCLDLRERITAENLDHASLFFRTDHHWTPSAGLWAANEVAAHLHDHYGMGFDPELTAPERYRTYRVSDSYLTGQRGFARLVNHKRGNGKTLCVIKDSFASVLLPHLAIQYGKLVILDPRRNQKTPLFATVEKENVDALVYILNPNSLIRKNGFFGRQMLRQ